MDEVIQTHGLTRSFGGRRVVDGLTLAVPRGAIYALLGDNGAGKSTTIRMLMGLLPADSGSARLLDQDCWSAAIALRHRVGYVPERPRYYDWMTVAEIGRFTAAFHRPGYAARYQTLTERFHLDIRSKLKTLSKGGYARVGLALALAVDPEVLILDEPTSGLDLLTRREFLRSMVDLAAEGRTILIASHAVAEVERVASHAAFLSAGRLLLAGPLDELRQRLVSVRVRHSELPVEPAGFGTVLACERSGREWQAFVLDPDRPAVEALRQRPGVLEVGQEPLTLEEMYTALLARTHHGDRRAAGEVGALVIEEKGDRR